MNTGELLARRYDAVLLDLDGVIYVGETVVPGAAEVLDRLHSLGLAVGYVTNNASRTPNEIVTLLRRMGIRAVPEEVTTSAQAAARYLAERFPARARVLVVGARALWEEVTLAGLTPAADAEDVVAVVQGYDPAVSWVELAEAAVAVQTGAVWIATNTDRTLPSPRGLLPGNGSLVAALACALGREPDVVVGKPEPTLLMTAAAARGARRPLFVGDRLDTDIAGARRVGFDSLLVLTGVHGVADVTAAPESERPTFVGADLRTLLSVPD
ncbi:MAG: HAD-IIA family hydrolase [Longispora sp.]|nr:HAD-IIA family hydrolase [Longispora sp. (in: high G+C Gram-positive bacteria)]